MNLEFQENYVIHHPFRSEKLNIRKLLLMVMANWYLYLIAIVITGGLAYYYIRHKIPVYQVSAMILIEEGESAPAADMLEGFAARPGAQNLDNQILILSSRTLVRKTVDELPFEIDCYRKGFLSRVSYYPLDPVRIIPGPAGLPVHIEFTFVYDQDDRFHLTSSAKSGLDLDTMVVFGQSIDLPNGSFTIYPQPELEDIYKSGSKIYFKFYTKEKLAENYQRRIKVENASRDGTIIRVSLQGTNKIKDVVFLDKLTEVFINNNLEKKNVEAKRIIEFIDNQLINVSDSLMVTENQLQEFRSKNRIMDVSAQAQQIIDQAVVLENTQARLTLEKNYYQYLDEYMSTEENKEAPIAPATMGIEDPLLASLMQELAGLQAQYFSSGGGERNPLQGQIELRINNTKKSIKETLSGIMLANQMAIDENAEQINKLNAQASRLPVKERQLLGIERKFNLNNVLYTFLLQRRAEAQIQKASNTPDNELIDPAIPTSLPISPNKRGVFLFAFSLALGLPTLLLILSDLIRNKVTSEDDLKMITNLPVVGHIPHSRLDYNTQVLSEPGSVISEAFRSLRTRMEFITRDAECPVILLSSSSPGEGKTFSAINLASAYSLMGKRTLLVGFDLRRPTLSKSFIQSDHIGLTNFLIGKNSLEEIIIPTEYENLHIIQSGPVPPNPGELTASKKVEEMFQTLKRQYDYIIVDSAPLGTVSDNYPIAALANATVVMVRHGFTKKSYLQGTLSELQSSGIKGISLLLNDLSLKGSSYRYSSNYKYEYSSRKKTLNINSKKFTSVLKGVNPFKQA
jgi:tyrosine-protein kinase Etk/Wzc